MILGLKGLRDIAHRNYSLRFIHSNMNKDKVYFEYQFQEKVSSGVETGRS